MNRKATKLASPIKGPTTEASGRNSGLSLVPVINKQSTGATLAVPLPYDQQPGRKMITAACSSAYRQGLTVGMTVVDAKATFKDVIVLDGKRGLNEKLLKSLTQWRRRYIPFVAVGLPDGLLLGLG